MLSTVAAFHEPWEAHMLRGRLAAEGIPAFVDYDQHIGNRWDLSIALGGVKVRVPDDKLDDARTVEKLCRKGAFAPVLEREFGPSEKFCCPKCGSTRSWKRRPLPRAALAVAISMLCGSVLPPLGWLHFCEKCGTVYRAQGRPAGRWLTILFLVIVQLLAIWTVVAGIWAVTFFGNMLVVTIITAMIAARFVLNRISKMSAPPD